MKTWHAFFISIIVLADANAQSYSGKKKDIEAIQRNSRSFSEYYVNAEYDNLTKLYSTDAKVLSPGSDITSGSEAIKNLWQPRNNDVILKHKATQLEISVKKNIAYDYGYYEGETLKANGEKFGWRGKYVIIWKKEKDGWKIYLDIWNRIG